MSVKNRLFAKYGHDCKLPSSLEDLPMFKSSTNILTQLKNIATRWRMCSEVNNRSLTFLRSQKLLDLEHRKHLRHLHIIHPFSDVRKWWEILMIVVLMIQFIMIPVDVCIYDRPMKSNFTETRIWKNIRLVCDCICLVDVMVTFLTGYCDYNTKSVVLDPKKIALHYLFTLFVPDLLSSIPTEFEAFGDVSEAAHPVLTIFTHLSMLKVLRFFSFLRYCRQFCHTYAINYPKYKLTMIFICYFLYYHYVCCISIYIATFEYTNKKGDILLGSSKYSSKRKDMPFNLFSDIKTTYFFMLYGTTRLVNNAGFMKLGTTNMFVFSVVVWILSKIVNMCLLALVVDVIISKSSSSQKYYEMVSELRDYMRHKQLPEYLQNRILGYYEFRFEKSYFRESEILNTISGQLRQDVIMHSCRKLVENVDFFKDLPLPLLVRIVSNLRLELFLINDVVIKVNTVGDSMYFIGTGTVAIFSPAGREICHLTDGAHFGEVALIMMDTLRIATVVAVETCELYKLDRIEFIRAIMPYPDLMVKIQRIALERREETEWLDQTRRYKGDANYC